MKKVLLSSVIILSLLACGGDESTASNSNEETTVESSSEEAMMADASADESVDANFNAFNENLDEFKTCKTTATTNKECKAYLAKAVCEYYGIADLKTADGYLAYDELPKHIAEHSDWKKVGDFNEDNIQSALANLNNKPVLVFNNNASYVHVVALKPNGSTTKSMKWGNITVPTCISYFPTRPTKSFTDKGINYAFGSAEGLEIWTKK